MGVVCLRGFRGLGLEGWRVGGFRLRVESLGLRV